MRRTTRPGRALGVAVALLGTLGVLAAPAQAADAGSDESTLYSLTNSSRAAAGVSALSLDGRLSSIARDWAAQMAAQGAIAHNPNLKSQLGADWAKVGENVGYGGTIQAIHAALLNSPSHYRNIVDAEFERIGIGVVVANNTVWMAQVFLTPAHSTAAATAGLVEPEPAPSSTVAAVRDTAPRPTPTTTSTTSTVAPTTTTTAAATAPPPGLPLRLTLMVQQVRTLGVRP